MKQRWENIYFYINRWPHFGNGIPHLIHKKAFWKENEIKKTLNFICESYAPKMTNYSTVDDDKVSTTTSIIYWNQQMNNYHRNNTMSIIINEQQLQVMFIPVVRRARKHFQFFKSSVLLLFDFSMLAPDSFSFLEWFCDFFRRNEIYVGSATSLFLIRKKYEIIETFIDCNHYAINITRRKYIFNYYVKMLKFITIWLTS